MINNISESAIRVVTKVDPNVDIHDKEANLQRTNELDKLRPVEQSEASNKAQSESKPKNDGSSRYLMSGNRVVFEKYDKDGDVVLRIPPSEKPVDKMA